LDASSLRTESWYSGYVHFSDWRGKPPVTWATNPAVSMYYSGGSPKSLRGEVELRPGDILGIDYYALMIPPLVNGRPLLPVEFHRTFADTLSKGAVIILQVE